MPGGDRLRRARDHPGLALFAVLWALAAMWHVLGNTGGSQDWAHVLLVLSAGWVLWEPGEVRALGALAFAGMLTVWAEAPVLGNHWLLVGLVDLAILVSIGVGALRRLPWHRGDLATRLFPTARLCVLAFYAFAAFAKLNAAFFDRRVSCAVYYFEESTSSLGLEALQLDGAGWLQHAVIFATAGIELSIPVLLVWRRSRNVGVLVALLFHGVLALDRTHQFVDFSSVLTALFLLFLPATAGTWLAERVGSVTARLALRHDRLPMLVHLVLAAPPVAAGLLVTSGRLGADEARSVAWWSWQATLVIVIALVVRFLRQGPPAPARGALRAHHVVYLLVPLLAVLNGLTPYLEVKTGYGWNMYANLRTVDGDSNHFLVRGTLPLTDQHGDLVEIVRSGDPALQRYGRQDYALTFTQLRAYLSDHPEVSLVYRRGDELVSLQRAADRPELVEPLPIWREKLLLFRAVDLQSPERCVPTFGPAR